MGTQSRKGRRNSAAKGSSRFLSVPSSSTLLLDPQACLDDWKEQIKVKKSIPAHQQRLTFSIRDLGKTTCGSGGDYNGQIEAGAPEQIFKDLQTWHASLYVEDTCTKLIDPLVLSEGDELACGFTSRTVEELRQLGVPCKAFYLSFNRLSGFQDGAQFRELKDICIKVDKDLQEKTLLICLNGRLNGDDLPCPFRYHMHGRELLAKLSILEQTVEYRKLHKMRQHVLTPPSRDDSGVANSQSLVRAGGSSDGTQARPSFHGDYFIHFDRNHEFTAIIARESRQLRCIVLTVITIPIESARHATSDSSRVSADDRTPHSQSLVALSRDTSSVISFCESLTSSSSESQITNPVIDESRESTESLDLKLIDSASLHCATATLEKPAKKKKKKNRRKGSKKKQECITATSSAVGSLSEKEVEGKQVDETCEINGPRKHRDMESSTSSGIELGSLLDGNCKMEIVHREASTGSDAKDSFDLYLYDPCPTSPLKKMQITNVHLDADGSSLHLEDSPASSSQSQKRTTTKASRKMPQNSHGSKKGSGSKGEKYIRAPVDPKVSEKRRFSHKHAKGRSSMDHVESNVVSGNVHRSTKKEDSTDARKEDSTDAKKEDSEAPLMTSLIETETAELPMELPQDMPTLSLEDTLLTEEDAKCSISLCCVEDAVRERDEVFVSEDEDLSEVVKQLTQNILDAVHTSFDSKFVYDNKASKGYHYLGEFEKFLKAAAPALPILPSDPYVDCKWSRSEGINRCFVCTEKLSNTSVSDIWQWYLEPSSYGLEVKVSEYHQHSSFQAFFVPYLSGLQFFHRMGKPTSSTDDHNLSPTLFGNIPILSTLLPKPASDSDGRNVDGLNGRCCCHHQTGRGNNVGLLFEFYEGERPHYRKPFFDRLEELASGNVDPNSHMAGDVALLKSLKLGDLHPASWFAVAWYPIYRIPDARFRAAFLTYHSLSHFERDSNGEGLCQEVRCESKCVRFPVVGLASYNAVAEYWFQLPPRGEIMDDQNDGGEADALQQRLSKLERAAAVMAGANAIDSDSISQKHSDYKFFSTRGR